MLGILLDFDGTLIDSDTPIIRAEKITDKLLGKGSFRNIYKLSHNKDGLINSEKVIEKIDKALGKIKAKAEILRLIKKALYSLKRLLGAKEIIKFFINNKNINFFIFTDGAEEEQSYKIKKSKLLTKIEIEEYVKIYWGKINYLRKEVSNFKKKGIKQIIIIDDKLEIIKKAVKIYPQITPIWHCFGRHNHLFLKKKFKNKEKLRKELREETGFTPFFTLSEIQEEVKRMVK